MFVLEEVIQEEGSSFTLQKIPALCLSVLYSLTLPFLHFFEFLRQLYLSILSNVRSAPLSDAVAVSPSHIGMDHLRVHDVLNHDLEQVQHSTMLEFEPQTAQVYTAVLADMLRNV